MKTVVMTGGTNGIGRIAADLLREDGAVRLLVGARAGKDASGKLSLDLSRLSSVHGFADEVRRQVAGGTIDALVLNAGMQTGSIHDRTEDGFETTFAVNHLAHYLLLRLLLPYLSDGATIVMTTSNLHDPATNTVAPPQHADAIKLAKGEPLVTSGSDARAVLRVYAASKLCNILTAHTLLSVPTIVAKRIRVIAFNPGFTPGTRLTRSHGLPFRLFFTAWIKMRGLFERMNTMSGGGALLADLALGRIVPPPGCFYASQVSRRLIWPDPSRAACDDALGAKLWTDSAQMVGLPFSR